MGWRYRVEFPGGKSRQGSVDEPVSIPYRLEGLGSHRVRIELIGSDDPIVVEKRLVVTDPASDFDVLDLLPIEEIWHEPQALSPEGIVLYGSFGSPDHGALYIANHRTGEVLRLDAGNFDPVPGYGADLAPGVEGLAVTPSGQRLLAAHKESRFSVARLGELETEWSEEGIGEYYVEVLDESHALVSGLPLVLVNLDLRQVEREAANFHARHFAVDRQRGRVAVSNLSDGTIDILQLPSLSTLLTIPLDPLHARLLAFDPHENKVYVLAEDESGQAWFLVVDPSTGDRISKTSLGSPGCSGYCVANPVVTFGGGRYVAFEQSSSVLVVDTALDLPRYRFGAAPVGVVGGPAGVAAELDSEILYVLGGPYYALTKIRLAEPDP